MIASMRCTTSVRTPAQTRSYLRVPSSARSSKFIVRYKEDSNKENERIASKVGDSSSKTKKAASDGLSDASYNVAEAYEDFVEKSGIAAVVKPIKDAVDPITQAAEKNVDALKNQVGVSTKQIQMAGEDFVDSAKGQIKESSEAVKHAADGKTKK